MAFIKGPFKITGKLGNSCVCERDGELILRSLPVSVNIVSEEVIKNYTNFGTIQDLYHVVCFGSDMKKIWRYAYPKRQGLNTFFTQRNTCFRSIADMQKLIMSPGDNFTLTPECELFWDEYYLKVKVPVISPETGLNPNTENFIKIVGFYHLYNPVEDTKEPFRFEHIETQEIEIQYSTDIIFSLGQISPKHGFFHELASYNNTDIYIVLITLTDKDMPVRTSQKMRLVMK